MDGLYQERIMEHYRSGRNRGILNNPSFQSGSSNHSCGDAITFCGIMEGGRVKQVLFEGKGCILSQAAASLLADHVREMDAHELLSLGPDSMRQLMGITVGPTRMQCILLALSVLQEGVKGAISC